MIYNSENSLPNHRVVNECCFTCTHFDPGLELEDGDYCGVLERIQDEMVLKRIFIQVCTSTSKHNVCDLWEKVN